ncbi:hypothetical protein DID76_00775 [Candidatus Marinamargulisbacteria bacterium SCGC AG-414-C22]|nr:hypothetical protein DID76_00775 [Candidatus Marinamargulisbacteria bacterium SCGC AG-414-C22]
MKTEFTKETFDHVFPEGIGNHFWHSARNRIVFHTLKQFNLHNTHILDVGCGKGVVLKYLLSKKVKVSGVELAPITPYAGLESYISTGIKAEKLNKKKIFETILLLDVIEHIENPCEFITNLSHHFSNVNQFVITVPARKELWSTHDEFLNHFRRYDLKTVDHHGLECSLKVKFKRYFFHSLYIPILLNKKRQSDAQEPRGILKIFHGMLSLCCFLEFLLTPKFIFGSSIIFILEKK